MRGLFIRFAITWIAVFLASYMIPGIRVETVGAGIAAAILLALPAQWVPWPLLTLLALGSIAAELFLAVGLWLPMWRRNAAIVGVVFHGTLVASMQPAVAIQLGVFAVACTTLYLLFFDGRVPRPHVHVHMRGREYVSPRLSSGHTQTLVTGRRAVTALAPRFCNADLNASTTSNVVK